MFFEDRDMFMLTLAGDIASGINSAKKKGLIPVFRLNGTSDIRWETITVGNTGATIFDMFPDIQFYDYRKTKIDFSSIPNNYHITFSRSENNDDKVLEYLQNKMNVAVVFAGIPPKKWKGFRVISGDSDDLRFLDPVGVVVGLVAKGKAKRDTSGFVIKI